MTVDRNTLTYGTYEPTYDTTGVPAGTSLTTYNGDITVTTDGAVYDSLFINGRVVIQAANVVFKNCKIVGTNAAPSSSVHLVDCRPASCVNATIQDCELYPQYRHWNWGDGIIGHDFSSLRNNIRHMTDGVGVYNTYATFPYNTNVVIKGNWIHDMAWWTAATTGIVHPSDTESHNDCIQVQGGLGTVIVGNTLDAMFARQYAHWWVTSLATEPYTTVALHSLTNQGEAGGPYQTIPDRASGNDASGRYNWDDLSCIMVNANVGDSAQFVITDNVCRGGNYAVNAGGVNYNGYDFGDILRNTFDTKQGAQSSGVPNTYTIQLGTGWAGHVNSGAGTVDANRYFGTDVNVRGD